MYEDEKEEEIDELPDHYLTLGVYRGSTKQEIEKAYRELVKKWHPDKSLDRHTAQKKLAEINKAYEVLGNERNRMEYDMELKDQERRDMMGDEYGMPGTLFSDESESSMDMHKFKQQLRELNEQMEKQDPHWQKINTDFNSSPDNICRPDDPILDTPYKRKLYDFMVGTVDRTYGLCSHFDLYISLEDIHLAKAKKVTIKRRTSSYNYENFTFTVPIRRDMREGEIVRIDSGGHWVDKNLQLTREPGCCWVHIHISKHDFFTKVGIDLHVTYLLSLKEARDGFERTLIDLDGVEHNIKIDKLERTDQIYLIRGKGMKKYETFRGNIVVNFVVKLEDDPKKKKICKIDINPMPKTKPDRKKLAQKNVVDMPRTAPRKTKFGFKAMTLDEEREEEEKLRKLEDEFGNRVREEGPFGFRSSDSEDRKKKRSRFFFDDSDSKSKGSENSTKSDDVKNDSDSDKSDEE